VSGGLSAIPNWGLIAAVSMIWGGNLVVTKVALRDTEPLTLVTLRATVGAVAIGLLARRAGAMIPRDRRTLLALSWIGLNITTLSAIFGTFGVERIPAGLASLLLNTMPLLTIPLAWALLGERPDTLRVMGVLGGLVGTALIALPSWSGDVSLLGIALMLGAAVTWALGSVGYKQFDLTETHAYMVVAMQLALSTVMLTPVALTFESIDETTVTARLTAAIAYLGVVGFGFTWVIWRELLRRKGAVKTSATAYLIPVSGVAFGAFFLGERLAPLELVGGAAILGAIVFVNRNTPVELKP
jgi:drug/metabolite transporter (DMT)-like permease